MLPAASVGAISPVVVNAEVPDVDVIVGKLGAPAAPGVGTKTTTPRYGEPVGRPAAFVGVITPVVVNAEIPAVDVTVGKPDRGWLGAPSVGTKMTTPMYGRPVGIPAEFVGVRKPVLVNAELPEVDVIVGKPVGDWLRPPDVGTKTITPENGTPALPTELVGVIRPVVVNAELPAIEVMVGKPVLPEGG